MLSVKNVSKVFGGLRALNAVSIDLEAGGIRGVIGPNGAGKTTLMNLISGFGMPDSGSVSVDDIDVTGKPAHRICRAGVARTFQNLQMFSDMTVEEVVATGAHRHLQASLFADLLRLPASRRDEAQAADEARELLDYLNISDTYRKRRAGDLPYGIQRRVEIARALATGPRYLLLDEPAAGLNDEETGALGEVLMRIKARGIGIALIEHDLELVMRVSDHVFVLDAGTVIASGRPDVVRADPAVVAAYLGDGHAG
ncbi:MAG: ABC transporter ATP-binding protein [Janthinobacterium lividum]